jgi:hypothetical protein
MVSEEGEVSRSPLVLLVLVPACLVAGNMAIPM